jgi:hypothetical protein
MSIPTAPSLTVYSKFPLPGKLKIGKELENSLNNIFSQSSESRNSSSGRIGFLGKPSNPVQYDNRPSNRPSNDAVYSDPIKTNLEHSVPHDDQCKPLVVLPGPHPTQLHGSFESNDRLIKFLMNEHTKNLEMMRLLLTQLQHPSEPKSEPKSESKSEPKSESKRESKREPKRESKSESKREHKVKVSNKAEKMAEKPIERRGRSWTPKLDGKSIVKFNLPL